MSQRILLIGLGMQGQAALHDLANREEFARIVVADSRPDLPSLVSRYPEERVRAVHCNADEETRLAGMMGLADIVVEALPAARALRMGELAARQGVALVSSMYYFNPDGLDAEGAAALRARVDEADRVAKQRGVAILTEFGMDPGLDLLMAAKAVSEFDEVHTFNTYGAGLPAGHARRNPLQYKFSWSPVGVMRSYRRPATVIRGGQAVVIPAREIFEAGNCHSIDVPQLGTPLECFANGDAAHYAGLLGIRGTARESGRYTGRYPGHCAFWDTVVKSGLLGSEAVSVGGAAMLPAEYLAAALSSQRQFQYGDGERDLSFIRVEASGLKDGKARRVRYELIDYRDLDTGFTAMQRTVGFTMSRGAQLMASGKVTKAGVLTPLDVAYEDVLPALEEHGIRVEIERG
ncbi:MAG TPA: saccharopine dehydrogenase C-terminal domain-containing protein [Verrucomicrobiae bacterium]|nr:saccharopine dehydrogenase C-terminal domain-containing protein [Verrucomicrobiae bacterium]